MPLFMDLHKFSHITCDEAKKAHLADERIQREYGVNYLQFWVNEEAGTLFCLVEGPDKETLETVHRLAHGHVACALVEVDPSYCSLIMGNNIRVDGGLVHRESGLVDPGTRFMLTVSYYEKTRSAGVFAKTHESIVNNVSKYNGRRVKLSGDDSLVSVFDSAEEALQCAKSIQQEFLNDETIVFTIGISAGQPVTENNEFIEETIRLAKRLSLVAKDGQVVVSSLFDELCDNDFSKEKNIRALSAGEEVFLSESFSILDAELPKESFSIDDWVKSVGVSRAQLYRKLQALTGKAPNNFIRDLRLDKAKSLLRRKKGNISEVAYEVGFGNPSYFAKCFAKRFGCVPSEVV